MSLMESIKTCFGKYITFAGRASRSEFWWFVVFIILGGVIAGMLDNMLFGPRLVMLPGGGFVYSAGWVGILFVLATILPNWAVTVRRLHDIGKSGWWILIGLIPLVGIILLIVWYATAGNKGNNSYGADPLENS